MTLSSPKCRVIKRLSFKYLFPLALAVSLISCSDPGHATKTKTVTIRQKTEAVNINTSGSKELQSLSGIGPRTAGKIIEHRNEFGPFRTAPQLMLVEGIGEKQFLKIRGMVRTE